MNQVKFISFCSFLSSGMFSGLPSAASLATLYSSAFVITNSLIASKFCLKLFFPVLLHLSFIWSITFWEGYSRVKSSIMSSNLSLCYLLTLASSIFRSIIFYQAMCWGLGSNSRCYITGRLFINAGVKSLGRKLFALMLIGIWAMLPPGGPPICA